MARLWSSGFELNTTTNDIEWTSIAGSPSVQTTTVLSGTYALQISSLSSGTAKRLFYQFSAAASTGPYYFKFAFRYATAPSAENRIFNLNSSSIYNDTANSTYLTLSSTGTLTLYDEDGQIGSSSSALSANTWYTVEILFDISGSAGSHIVKARLDETEFTSATNRSISTGVNRIWIGGNINGEAQTTGNWYFDDFVINDSSDSFQNTWPGIGEIIHLRPNATGDNSAWSGTNTDIDEVTPDDIVSSISESTNNDIEDVNIDATPAALASTDTINVVQVGWRFRTNSTSGTNPTAVLRIKAAASGTVEESANRTFNSTTWHTNATAAPRNYLLTLYDLPGASTTVWTKSDLDSTQIGVRLTNSPTGIAYVSTLWLLVDHKPATVSTVRSSRLTLLGVG